MTREEEIKKASQEFARSIASIRPELNADSFRRGAEWSDSKPPKGTSLIKWQTGEPTEEGYYLVSLTDNNVMFDYYLMTKYKEWFGYGDKVVAWCEFIDIKPYKE